MVEIPDEVVARALSIAIERKGYAQGKLTLDEYEYAFEEVRAIGRVFVEWERERCARIADGARHNIPDGRVTDFGRDINRVCDGIATSIRARSLHEKE